jgi:hypothetical protein
MPHWVFGIDEEVLVVTEHISDHQRDEPKQEILRAPR